MFANYIQRGSGVHDFYRLNFRFTIASVAANFTLLQLIASTLNAGLVSLRADGLRCDFYCNSLADLPLIIDHYEDYPFLSFNDHRLSIVQEAFGEYDTDN